LIEKFSFYPVANGRIIFLVEIKNVCNISSNYFSKLFTLKIIEIHRYYLVHAIL